MEQNLDPDEPSRAYASNGAPADPGCTNERTSQTAAEGVVAHDRLHEPVMQQAQAIVIDGYRVPTSLAATVIPEPYSLPSPSRSMVGMLVDFGSTAAVAAVAAVVALVATGELPRPWDIAARGKTEERSIQATTYGASTPSPERFLPTRPQSGAALAAVPTPPSADSDLAATPGLSAATDLEETDKGQHTAAAVSPAEASLPVSPDSVQLIIARELQGELRRVGCDPGNLDGDWNAASRRALENFDEHAGTQLGVGGPNFNALAVVRSKTSRICPLVCERGSRAQGHRCVEVDAPNRRRHAERNHVKRSSASAVSNRIDARSLRVDVIDHSVDHRDHEP